MDPSEYKKRVENEKKFYDESIYQENLIEKTTTTLAYVLEKFQKRVKNKLGMNVWEYTISSVNNKSQENDIIK